MVSINIDFLDWAILNELGLICGIRDDAPDWIKEQYEKYYNRKDNIA